MDTITRSEMAIAVAEEGGIGIIDRGFRSGDIEPQVREVERVKRRQHGIIADPYTIRPNAPLTDAASVMQRTGVGTLVVVDENRRIVGLLTTRDLRFADRSKTVVGAHDAARPPRRAGGPDRTSPPLKTSCASTRSRSCRSSTPRAG